MNKLPTPVVVGAVLVAVLIAVLVIYKNASNTGTYGDSGNTTTIAADVLKSSPKGELPAGSNPTAGAMTRGKR